MEVVWEEVVSKREEGGVDGARKDNRGYGLDRGMKEWRGGERG